MKKKQLIFVILFFLFSISVFALKIPKIDIRYPINERVAIDERSPLDIRYGIDVDLYERELYQRFGSFVDEVYTISIKAEGEINATVTVDGRLFDLKPIMGDVTVGTVIIITTAFLPYLIPVTGESSVAILVAKVAQGATQVAIEASASAALLACANGIKEYIVSDGNYQKTLYSVIEGAGQGFKWGAIVAGVKNFADAVSFVSNYGSDYIVDKNHKLIDKNSIPWLEGNIRRDLANSTHPDTGVPYIERIVQNSNGELRRGAFPVFDSLYDVRLDSSLYLEKDRIQFSYANKQLSEAIQSNLALRDSFSSKQIEQIMEGLTPDGYTWHHNEETGLMQLVESTIHEATRHTGGKSLWGGGAAFR